MTDKEKLIKALAEHLQNTDATCDPILVNFFDDEIYWNNIAREAIAFLSAKEV